MTDVEERIKRHLCELSPELVFSCVVSCLKVMEQYRTVIDPIILDADPLTEDEILAAMAREDDHESDSSYGTEYTDTSMSEYDDDGEFE